MATKEEWLGLFEAVVGRKPTAKEYMAGKTCNFDPTQIIGIAGFYPKEMMSASSQAISEGEEVMARGLFSESHKTISAGFKMILTLLSLILSVALVVGVLVPPFLVIAVVFSIINLIAVAVSLFFNLKVSHKLFLIMATIVLGVVLLVSFTSKMFQNKASNQIQAPLSRFSRNLVSDNKDKKHSDNNSHQPDSTDVNDYIAQNASFDWTEEEFSSLEFFSYKHKKGTPLKEIIKSHGKANNAEISGNDLTLTYQSTKGKDRKEVRLRFEKQYKDQFILTNGSAYGISEVVQTNRHYRSNWTSDGFAKLTEGDSETGQGGSKWSEIQKKYGKPKDAFIQLSHFGEGISKMLMVTYSDYDSKPAKLSYVALDFVFKNGEYYLIHKYSDEDND